MKNRDVKKYKFNILKFLILLIVMYAFYKLPSIIATKGFYYHNKKEDILK